MAVQEAVPKTVRVRVAQTVIHLLHAHRKDIHPLLSALPEEQQRALYALVE